MHGVGQDINVLSSLWIGLAPSIMGGEKLDWEQTWQSGDQICKVSSLSFAENISDLPSMKSRVRLGRRRRRRGQNTTRPLVMHWIHACEGGRRGNAHLYLSRTHSHKVLWYKTMSINLDHNKPVSRVLTSVALQFPLST